jgi:hypothetical protein
MPLFLIPADCQKILIPMNTGQYPLVNSLRYQIKNIRWDPHSLSSIQNQARVEMSHDLIQVLRSAKHYAWTYIITLDETWFYFSNHFDRNWLPHDEPPPSFPKQTTESQKLMITVVWNPHKFHGIQSLSNGIKWTGRYDSDDVLSQNTALRDVGSHGK